MIENIAERFNLNGRFNVKRVMKENQINDRVFELESASKIAIEELERNSLKNQDSINNLVGREEVNVNFQSKMDITDILSKYKSYGIRSFIKIIGCAKGTGSFNVSSEYIIEYTGGGVNIITLLQSPHAHGFTITVENNRVYIANNHMSNGYSYEFVII